MNKIYKVAFKLWVVFAVTFFATCCLAILKGEGKATTISPYLYLIGPLSFFVGVTALITTSRGGQYTSAWKEPKKRALLELIGSLLNGFAFWLFIMGMAFLVGLMIRIDLKWPSLIASVGSTLIFIYGWSRIKEYRLAGIIGLIVFLSLLIRSLSRF